MNMLLLIIVLVLLFGGGGGYYGYSRWGTGGGVGDRRAGPDHPFGLVPVRRNAYAPLRFDRNREKAKQQLHSTAQR